MKKNQGKPSSTLSYLSEEEMACIKGGSIWEKLLSALLGVSIGAFYDMGKQEGRMARERMNQFHFKTN